MADRINDLLILIKVQSSRHHAPSFFGAPCRLLGNAGVIISRRRKASEAEQILWPSASEQNVYFLPSRFERLVSPSQGPRFFERFAARTELRNLLTSTLDDCCGRKHLGWRTPLYFADIGRDFLRANCGLMHIAGNLLGAAPLPRGCGDRRYEFGQLFDSSADLFDRSDLNPELRPELP